ncbi:AAA family ATPase [Streptomyces sp. DH24]|uniref:ATP-binding protein n=1 Tax=Streptomyces sp. DH24 TaxID=3040123 RepID=UPI002442C225|nr:LuxR family transcriptional regulator [Streptomyces sp. DH24]MDG9715505.1 AAA family ATPase [Streptomyces sp. DH24]
MASPIGAQTADEPGLVGRDLELSLVREHVHGAGEARAVLLRGPAGIGKTRLMSAALGEPADAHVLTVKCQESGAGAYAAVRALFAPLGLTAGDRAGHPLLSGSARLALPALTLDGAPAAVPADTYAVMHGLYWLTAGLAADRPVVLAVDDVQWCDEASLRWLGFLLRRAEDLPVALFMTLRSEVEIARPEVLDEMADAASCLTVDVQPLPADAVRDMLTAALGAAPAPALVDRCMEITGGTPFLVQLVAGELKSLPPVTGLAAAALSVGFGHGAVARFRVDRLTPERLAVAKAVAVLETDDLEPVAALAGTRPGPASRAVDALRDAGLLHTDSLGYRHDLIRQAVLDATPDAELVELRERAARLLNDSGSPAEQVAVQLMRLPDIPEPWMVTALRSAALGAEQRGAPAVAGQYLTRALRHDPDDVELLSESARTLASNDPRTALSRLEHALTLATEPRLRCRLILQYVVTALGAQHSLRAFELVNEALELCESELGDSPADQALRTRVEAMVLVAGLDEKTTVRRVSERFRDHAAPAGESAEERLLLGMLCALGTLEGRPAAELVPAAERVLRVGDVSLGGWGALGSSLTLYLADEIKPVDAALTALLEHAQKRGEAWICALASTTRAQVHLWAGNITQALSDAQLAFDLAHGDLRVFSAVGPQCALAEALVHRGEAHRAEELLDMIGRPRLDQFSLEYHTYLVTRARSRAALGDLDGALRHLRQCGDSLAGAGIGNPVLAPWWYDAAEVLAELGRRDEGLEMIEEVAPAVRRWGTPRARGMLHYARGVLTEGDAAVDELTEAARLLDGSAGRLESTRAEYLLGRRLLDRGDAEGARERLRRSIDLAVLCGSKLLLDQAVPVLAAAGGRLRHSTESPTDALSGSERQVAERAAAGATNREIAEALFLTQRTVEFHLTSAYRKLGIRGRQELADVLAGSWKPER